MGSRMGNGYHVKTVEPHDLRWAGIYRAEAQTLERCFGDAQIAAHHIGSTAIPGIFAKPTIDILVVARGLNEIDAKSAAMAAVGYEVRGAHGIDGRRYFTRLDPARIVRGFHVHVFAHGSPQINRHLCFRDFLRERPDIAGAYSELKLSLAGPRCELAADYAERKSDFVRSVLTEAMRWREESLRNVNTVTSVS